MVLEVFHVWLQVAVLPIMHICLLSHHLDISLHENANLFLLFLLSSSDSSVTSMRCVKNREWQGGDCSCRTSCRKEGSSCEDV